VPVAAAPCATCFPILSILTAEGLHTMTTSTPRLNVVREGDGPFVVLSHALGCDLHMWDGVAAQLARAHTVIRYDHRNHGGSEVVPGVLRVETLAQDAAELIARETGGEPVHFVGLSMGGMTA